MSEENLDYYFLYQLKKAKEDQGKITIPPNRKKPYEPNPLFDLGENPDRFPTAT